MKPGDRRMPRKLSPPEASRRRYSFVQPAVLAAFALAMVVAGTLMPRAQEAPQRWLLAAGPIALLAWCAWEFFKVIRNDDEMLQAFYLRAVAISGMLVLLAGTMWGILERFLLVPPFPSFLLLPAFSGVFGLTTFAFSRHR
jgi:hypothetical protein